VETAVVDRDALVIGAGVIGLTSAIALAEAGVRTRIRTAAMPQETTSRAAGAMWGSSFAGPEAAVRRWAEAALAELREEAGDPASGVRIARGMLAARSTTAGPPPGIFPGIAVARRDDVPAGYVAAFGVDVPLIDMPVHLDYLLARFEALGGTVEVERVAALADLEDAAPVIVNCTGIGARELVPDPSLRAVRGQHVVVENPGVEEFFMEEPGPVWASWMPHGDRVVLGGSADEDDWRPAPDLAIADAIVERCAAVEPRFAGARVVEHRVGLRPFRPEVRVEIEPLGTGRVVHNYGHGGTGVGLAWGCAREVAALVAG
jgi:D-amino-acid oxidase